MQLQVMINAAKENNGTLWKRITTQMAVREGFSERGHLSRTRKRASNGGEPQVMPTRTVYQ